MSSEEESEWEGGESDESEDSDRETDDDEGAPSKRAPKTKALSPLPKQKPRSTPSKKKRKVRAFQLDSEDEEEDLVPSHARLTERGGYSHTNRSRIKISRANRGNIPWNKGKNRSEAAKARISQGVRERNRAVLEKKLHATGLTEEQWMAAKKDIKYIRERVRRTKKLNTQRIAEIKAEKYRLRLADNDLLEEQETQPLSNEEVDGSIDADSEYMENEEVDSEEGHRSEPAPPQEESETEPSDPRLAIFSRDVHWTPHRFDDQRLSYDMVCPTGGPGGLVCCTVCTAEYSKFLTSTVTDIQDQKISKIGEEMRQLLSFGREAKTRLSGTVLNAKRKLPPSGNSN